MSYYQQGAQGAKLILKLDLGVCLCSEDFIQNLMISKEMRKCKAIKPTKQLSSVVIIPLLFDEAMNTSHDSNIF